MTDERWLLSLRFIGGIPVERARVRGTLMYRFTERFRAGIELNPMDDDVGPIANWLILEETGRRPALVAGTSSARIGTTRGRAVYTTLSKNLEPWVELPLSVYGGISFDGQAHRFREIAGGTIRWAERWSTTHMWDGVNLHHQLGHTFEGGNNLGLLVAEQDGAYYYGLTFGASLDLGVIPFTD